MKIKPLSELSLANILSNMVGSLFMLLLFSLVMQKLFILMRLHLFIFSFMSFALGDITVKLLLHGISEIFLPMFSSRTFMVSQLIFKSFDLIYFSVQCKLVLEFHFLHAGVQVSQHHFLKRLFLFLFILLPTLSNVH